MSNPTTARSACRLAPNPWRVWQSATADLQNNAEASGMFFGRRGLPRFDHMAEARAGVSWRHTCAFLFRPVMSLPIRPMCWYFSLQSAIQAGGATGRQVECDRAAFGLCYQALAAASKPALLIKLG